MPLLADPDHVTAKAYGIVGTGRARAPLDLHPRPRGVVRYRHVALLGLRYKDVEHLAAALALARQAPRMSAGRALEPAELTLVAARLALAGEAAGEGPPIVLLHGLTASRRYVVHGSRVLPRGGLRTRLL